HSSYRTRGPVCPLPIMSKLVFKPASIANVQESVDLELPDRYKRFQGVDDSDEYEVDAEGNVIEQYHGPSIEEIEEELNRYRKETEEQIQGSLEDAHERAKQIEEEGKSVAFNLIQEKKEEAKRAEEAARLNAEQIVER